MSVITDSVGAILSRHEHEIKAWFEEQYAASGAFFYSSVDLRHSGHKIAPVDTNLFPAGFNLLSEAARQAASTAMREYFRTRFPAARKLLLIPESHTRNLAYLENVHVLKTLLEHAGLSALVGSLAVEGSSVSLQTAEGNVLTIEPLAREGNMLTAGSSGFRPDIVLINNDLSAGVPEILVDIVQPVIPPVRMGWHRRRKTNHFDAYRDTASSFAKLFGFDPWLISTLFHKCGQINFKESAGLQCLAVGVEKVLHGIRQKYGEYGITDQPYVFIKADSGTYGMGIMTARSPEEALELNKKTRNKMSIIKEGVENTEVIIQEGVPTIDRVRGKAAEPLIYLIAGNPVGCTYRINENRDAYGNLNSPGMTFANVCRGDGEESDSSAALCPAHCVAARLASLAAVRECYEPAWSI